MRNLVGPAILLGIAVLASCRSLEDPRPAVQIDHVVVGAPNLESAISETERLTGVRPEFGGVHPGRGTQNALLSLGGGVYLELLAPQPDAPTTSENEDLLALETPLPVAWAVTVRAAESVVESLRKLRFDPSAPEAGSRRTDSGGLLEWHTFGLRDAIRGAPFFIEWHPASPHPATTSPSGCTLLEFQIATPDAAELQRLVAALGLNVRVVLAAASDMSVELQCPRGRVTFPSAP
ncbi:MAG: VOC family protein [Acidobacteria bacterium]|nr:VOC family protein [Acidobacteriota bacterium]